MQKNKFNGVKNYIQVKDFDLSSDDSTRYKKNDQELIIKQLESEKVSNSE